VDRRRFNKDNDKAAFQQALDVWMSSTPPQVRPLILFLVLHFENWNELFLIHFEGFSLGIA
jgi:hypothetical protein